MFLILTGHKKFFENKRKQEIIYLGKWCLVNDCKSYFFDDGSRVLPYPFDVPGSLYEAYQYLQVIYHHLMPQITNLLNELHEEKHSQRYWEIVIGYWLREYLEILYERYVCICAAQKQYPKAKVRLLASDCYICPQNGKEFGALYLGHLYNHQLYSQIIDSLNFFDIERIKISSQAWKDDVASLRIPRVKFVKQFIKWTSLLLSRWNRVYISSTYFPIKILVRLALSLKIFPTLDTPHFFFKNSKMDFCKRKVLECLVVRDEFEHVIKDTLKFNLPKIYVENYANLKKRVAWFFPKKKARLILTANAYAVNDGFKLWTAKQVEKYQTPFVILQHGGRAKAKWYSSEDYEKRIADYYLTYGWKEVGKQNVIPHIANRLLYVNDKCGWGNARGGIFWILTSCPRYSYAMFSGPVSSQFQYYLDDQVRFLNALSKSSRALIRCRPFHYQYGWFDLEYIEKKAGKFELANSRLSIWLQLKVVRLFVCTYDGTANIEAWAANIPLIMYWNPAHWEMKDEMIYYCNLFHELGILHYTPESAAAKIEKIKDDTFGWWMQPGIQSVRKEYCEQFVHTSPDAVKKWADMINRLSGS